MAKRVPNAPADKPPRKRTLHKPPTQELPSDNWQAIFGQEVRTARLKRDMTQAEVADLAGMNLAYLGKIENGEKNVTLDTMKKLTAVLDLDLSLLFRLVSSGGEPSS